MYISCDIIFHRRIRHLIFRYFCMYTIYIDNIEWILKQIIYDNIYSLISSNEWLIWICLSYVSICISYIEYTYIVWLYWNFTVFLHILKLYNVQFGKIKENAMTITFYRGRYWIKNGLNLRGIYETQIVITFKIQKRYSSEL